MSGVAPGARARRVEDPASMIAALLPTGAGAYLAWSAYRADRVEAAAVESAEAVADRLAIAVRRQWETEAQVRRLEDPYALPVSWRAADADLAEVALAGGAGEIREVFEGLPGRRLLVLGDPGSGKTMLLVRLLPALLGRRREGEPVPVLFPLASWDPAADDLRGWMEQRLVQDHPDLGAVDGGVSLAATLLDRRLVLPVLDGFDELPAAVGASALHRIAEALPYGCGVVLSSRPAEYRAALRPRTGVPARLAGMAGVHLEPLGAEDVAAYLLRDAGGEGTAAAARWQPVAEALGTDVPAARALTSPLMVSLARAVYNPRPGQSTGQLPDPAELLRCPAQESVADHLFEAFVDAAYRPHPRRPSRWTAAQARTALGFLARRMERGFDGAAEVAWWKLNAVVPSVLMRVLAGGLLGALAWLLEGASGELMHHFTHEPADLPQWQEAGALGVLAAGVCAGLVGGLTAGLVSAGLCAIAAGPALSTGLVLHGLGPVRRIMPASRGCLTGTAPHSRPDPPDRPWQPGLPWPWWAWSSPGSRIVGDLCCGRHRCRRPPPAHRLAGGSCPLVLERPGCRPGMRGRGSARNRLPGGSAAHRCPRRRLGRRPVGCAVRRAGRRGVVRRPAGGDVRGGLPAAPGHAHGPGGSRGPGRRTGAATERPPHPDDLRGHGDPARSPGHRCPGLVDDGRRPCPRLALGAQ